MSGTKCFLPLITGLVFLLKSGLKCFLIFRDLLESVSLFSENLNYVSYKAFLINHTECSVLLLPGLFFCGFLVSVNYTSKLEFRWVFPEFYLDFTAFFDKIQHALTKIPQVLGEIP